MNGFDQKVSSLAVFDINNPDIGISADGPLDEGGDVRLNPGFGRSDPNGLSFGVEGFG